MALAKKKNTQVQQGHTVSVTVKQASNAVPPYKSKYHVRLENAQKILAKYGDIDLLGTLFEMRREDAAKE